MVGTSNFMSLLLSSKEPTPRPTNWMFKIKPFMMAYMANIVKRGSKYIYRQKLSLKHFELQLKKFKFTEPQIRRINFIRKKFQKVFEENIKEIFYVNPKVPAGFNNPKGLSMEPEFKATVSLPSSSNFKVGMRNAQKREAFDQEMLKVIILFFSF
jgi:hypothetical protein